MPGSESAILDPLHDILRWGLTGLGVVIFLIAGGVLLRWLTSRWKARTEALAQQMDRGLVSLHHTLGQLRSEAAAYPPDLPAPYGPIVQQLQTAIDSIETTYQSLTHQVTSLGNHPLALPELAWARVGYFFWNEPRYWWRQRAALGRLVDRLESPRTEAAAANTLLRDLRKQPLDTASRARELYELVDTAHHTAGLLKTGGVHGTPLDTITEVLKAYRRTLTALPIYLFACTDSQIMRRAQPQEIAEAWAKVDALDAEIRRTTAQVAAWHDAYTLAGQELETMIRCVEAAIGSIQETPEAIDISDLIASWRKTSEEAEALVACYEAPSTDALDCIDQITQVTQTANQVMAQLASLKALNKSLESNLTENADMLGQIDQQLRQLAGASRYPLDRVPMQVVLDQLTQQAAALDGVRSPGSKQAASRTPAQLESDLAAAQVLKQQAQSLVAQVAVARERRRHLIELLDHHAEEPQVDWLSWANDLHERIHLYTEANWFGPNGSSDQGSGKSRGSNKTPVEADLHVRTIVHDAAQLAERQTLWIPARINEPLAPDELERRSTELTALFADTEAFQDRLDKITQRFQLCQQIEEKAKADLATVYGATDRLDIVTADVLPPALANENNHWTQIREQLDFGYEIELALANPGLGTVQEKAQRVQKWIADTREILQDWQKALARETEDTVSTLIADLDELTAVAPLDGEAAVEQAREVAESLAGQVQTHKWPLGKRRPSEAPVTPGDGIASLTAQLSGELSDQLRTLATVDQALAALTTDAIEPLMTPIRIWREAEQTAEGAFGALQKLETESARLWPPVSCDTSRVKAEFDRADRIRDSLYQDGKTVAQVLRTLTTLTETYTTISTMVEQRETTYRAQRPALDDTLERMEKWCAALERYRDQHAGDPAVAAAVRARLDEIEAGWTQLQVRYDQAPSLVPGEEAQRTLNDLWLQARRDLPLGPNMDVITPGEVEG